jgi:hypothetical protein
MYIIYQKGWSEIVKSVDISRTRKFTTLVMPDGKSGKSFLF